MADSKPPPGVENTASTPIAEAKVDSKTPKPLRSPNPMWKYMGLGENFRPKLPSRNWSIFLAITGSFTAAVIYDKREKKRVQRKWCKLVEHIAKEPLGNKNMPRKLTVFLEGPPTDGLRIAQDHFKEYVKPILVASGLDWEFIQGRKEGDVRAELAEKIRNSRRPPGEKNEVDTIGEVRRGAGIKDFDGPQGDIVIGRHTWKEYVRGLHEGWLGPLTEPVKSQEEKPLEDIQPEAKDAEPTIETLPGISIDSNPVEASEKENTEGEANKPTKPPQLLPFISTLEYPAATTHSNIPAEFEPSTPISFPHILGFLNTPKRMYRFLNRRVLADSIGRETAAIILSTYRPYHTTSSTVPTSFTADQDASPQSPAGEESPQEAEQQTALIEEEKEWHKNARIRKEDDAERTWLDPVVLDPRIASRMRRSELTAEDEARAKTIVVTEEEIEGWIKGSLRKLVRSGKVYLGFGKKPIVKDDEELRD